MPNMPKDKGDTPVDLDAVVEDLAALRRDVAALLGKLNDGAVRGANAAAEDAIGRLGEQADRLYDDVAARGGRAARLIGRQVEERPVASLLIAFGLGFALSKLLSR